MSEMFFNKLKPENETLIKHYNKGCDMKEFHVWVEFHLCENHLYELKPEIKRGIIIPDKSKFCDIKDCSRKSKYKVEIMGFLGI